MQRKEGVSIDLTRWRVGGGCSMNRWSGKPWQLGLCAEDNESQGGASQEVSGGVIFQGGKFQAPEMRAGWECWRNKNDNKGRLSRSVEKKVPTWEMGAQLGED